MGDYDHLYKVILIGDASVGKSNILSQYISNKFDGSSKSTIGVEFATKTLIIERKRIKIQLWDTAGQERFRAVTSAYYRGSHGIVLVFDVTNRSSFEHIEKWLGEIKEHSDPNCITILVANKIDLSRTISSDECIEFASKTGIFYVETSAKDNVGIEDLFITCAREIYKSRKAKRIEDQYNNAPAGQKKWETIDLGTPPVDPNRKKCCK